MGRIGFLGFGLVSLLLAGGCASGTGGTGGDGGTGGGYPTYDDGGRSHSSAGSSWTFLVYLVADNDLEPFGLGDLEEMMLVGSGGGLTIAVQADRSADYTAAAVGGIANWTSAKRLLVQSGSLSEAEDLGEVNMGDPGTLADFISWGVNAYPADRYALVLWDHGGAWPGFGVDESTPNNDMLSLAELETGIADGLVGGGLDQLALIGFDACLMATYEVAMAMRPYGEFFLASEELEPGHGWDYTALSTAATNPGISPAALGTGFVNRFRSQAVAYGTQETITLGLIDLLEMDRVGNALVNFAAAMQGATASSGPEIGQERSTVLEFGRTPDAAGSTHMVDLGLLAQGVGARVGSVQSAASALGNALSVAVVAATAGSAMTGASGLSIYFPPLAPYYDASYDALENAAPWRDFLDDYFAAAARVTGGPVFTNADHLAEAQWLDATTLELTGQLAGGGAGVSASLYYGIADLANGTLFYLGDQPSVVSAGGLVSGQWDTSALVLTQGTTAAFAYMSLSLTEAGGVSVSIPLSYEDGGAPAFAILVSVFDPGDGSLTGSTLYTVSEAGVGELQPAPGSTLSPLILVVSGGAGEWQSDDTVVFDANGALDISWQYLPSGYDAEVDLLAQDFAGNSDFVYALVTL